MYLAVQLECALVNLSTYFVLKLLYVFRNGECDIGWAAFFSRSFRDQCVYSSSETCRYINETFLEEGQDVIQSPFPSEMSGSGFQCCVDFATSYFPMGMSLVYYHPSRSSSSTQAIIDALLGVSMMNACGFIATVTIIAAHIVWLLERKENPEQFSFDYLDGVGDGLWWSVVTLTTVGYGDTVPISKLGRIFGVFWMFMGLIVGAIFLGAISTAITITYSSTDTVASWSDYSKLCDKADSDDCRVCTYISVLDDIVAVKELNGMHVEIVTAEDFATCAIMMEAGEVSSIFMDNAIVTKGIESFEALEEEATISPPFYNIDNSLIFPDLWTSIDENSTKCLDANSTLIIQVNSAMLTLKETHRAAREAVILSYFGLSVLTGSEIKVSSSGGGTTQLNWWVVSPPFVLMCVYAITIIGRDMKRAKKTLSAISVSDSPNLKGIVQQIIEKNKMVKEEEERRKEETSTSFSVKSFGRLNDKFERRFKSMDRKIDVLLEALGRADAIETVGSSEDSLDSFPSTSPRKTLRRRSVSLGRIDALTRSSSFDRTAPSLSSLLGRSLSTTDEENVHKQTPPTSAASTVNDTDTV